MYHYMFPVPVCTGMFSYIQIHTKYPDLILLVTSPDGGTQYSAQAMCQGHLGGQDNATLTSLHHPPSFNSKLSMQKISIFTVLEAAVFHQYESSDSNITSLKKGI